MPEGPPSYTPGGVIIASAAKDYRLKRYALVAILLIYGLLSIKDGFYRYPRENAEAEQKFPGTHPPHPGFDVQLNQGLGVLLPPLSIAFLIWCLYSSRGQYRFDGQTLTVPGHPPIPLNALRKIDRAKWDRKGIAYIDYQFPGTSKAGRLKLDDFVYQREPTDRIFDALDRALGGSPASAPAAPTAMPAVAPPRPGAGSTP
jgi:hypothetical protein